MREEKVLGKIDFAEFGKYPDRPFLFGLQLGFSLGGGSTGVMDGGMHTVNISPNCQWDSQVKRAIAFTTKLEELECILTNAKVDHVSQLKGKPVEVTLEGNSFKEFRILTEVL